MAEVVVISHSRNFIFCRIPKNASSSLADWFAKNYCNKNDIWTDVNDRMGVAKNNIPQTLVAKYRNHSRYIHLTLQEIIDNDVISIEQAKSMQKIGVLRCPFERQLSLYFWLCRNRRSKHNVEDFRSQFKEGKHNTDTNNLIKQVDYYKINGKLEDTTWWLHRDIANKTNEFEGIHGNAEPIPMHKSGVRPTIPMNELIDQYYDEATLTAVRNYFQEDISLYETL